MKQAEFQKLLEGKRIGASEEDIKTNIDNISKQFKEASEQDREGFFDSLFHSTRYDVMKELVDKKALNEEELFNITLKCKRDDLSDADSIPNNVYQAALDQLDEERIPEFYSSLVNQLVIDSKNKLQLPSTETLQALFEGLFVAGHGQALRNLHNFLAYYKGTEGRNSEELIAAVRADDQEKAIKLISQGHYVYDFTKFDFLEEGKLCKFFFYNNLHHPNCNLAVNDKDGYTPMHWAVNSKHIEIAKEIMAAVKDNPDLLKQALAPNKIGNTPMHWAATNNYIEIAKEILAAVKDNPELLKQVLAPNNHGQTPLSTADDEIKQLIEEAMDKQNERNRAMHAACSSTSAASSTTLATTAMPASTPAAQVNSSATQLQQTSSVNMPNLRQHSRE